MILVGIAAVIVVGAIGIGLLYLAAQGQMPTAFGLLDMNQTGNRVAVIVVLLIVVAVLWAVYQRTRGGSGDAERDARVDRADRRV